MAGYTDPYGKAGNFLGNTGDPMPPYPDDVAARGTPEWRKAFGDMQNWKEAQVAIRGGAGDEEATKRILGQLGFQDVKEKGKHAFTMAAETAANARGLVDQSNQRQQWPGGNGRPLEDYEMESFEAVTGVPAKRNGNDPALLRKWQQAGGIKANPDDFAGGPTEDKPKDLWPGMVNLGVGNMKGGGGGPQGPSTRVPWITDPKTGKIVPQYPGMEAQQAQYNPHPDQPEFGGWSGAYGNNPLSTAPIPASSNPAGLTQPSIIPPASVPPPGQGAGMQMASPGVSGFNPAQRGGLTDVGRTIGTGRGTFRHRIPSSGFGGVYPGSQLAGQGPLRGPGSGMLQDQATLIRRTR